MISNLCLFAYAIAKALLLTGLGPGLVAGFLWSRVRVIEIGFEKVRGGQLARQNDRTFNTSESWATSPEMRRRANFCGSLRSGGSRKNWILFRVRGRESDSLLQNDGGGGVKPLAIDLYCGLGGWAEGFLAEGYRVIGFDVVRHDYGTGGYPGELVLEDVLALHGSQFADADIFVASPPCQKYSYMSMPWKKARDLARWYAESLERIHQLNQLFDACFRIQREASEAAGRHIPLVVENVRGAQRWVGYAKWHFGSYFLWGDVPALMPIARSLKAPGATNFSDFRKTGKVTPHWRLEGLKQAKRLYLRDGHAHTRHLTNPAEDLRVDESGIKLVSPGHHNKLNSGLDWFDRGAALFASDSVKRAAASAMLAKIPFPLAQYIARVFKPTPAEMEIAQ